MKMELQGQPLHMLFQETVHIDWLTEVYGSITTATLKMKLGLPTSLTASPIWTSWMDLDIGTNTKFAQYILFSSIFKTSWTPSFHFAHHLLAQHPNTMNSKPSWKESGVTMKKNPYGIIVWAWARTRDRHHLLDDMLFDNTGHCHYQKCNHDDYNRVPSQQWLIETCRPM